MVSDGRATAVDTVPIEVRDGTPPVISCGTADNAWHNPDVTIACTGR